MVNFLRGQRGNEGFVSDVAGKLYRTRDDAGVLGAIINAQPVYVRAPFSNYADDGYDAFKSSQSSRAHMLYVAANDGMLHAFKATGTDTEVGQEAWAVIPSAVLPRLYKLADASYGTNPEWTVDGTPSVGDAKIGGDWKTLLVAGLNGGGKGYYALDVTNPASPKALWEFKWSNTCYDSGNPATASADCHLGFTYGRPWITKLADGTWVVMVTSGYNNVNAPSKAGDGQGYLYVLDAANGHIIYKISTGQGDATTPSGLAQIGIFVDNATLNNTALRAYGGDLFGNVWRFDFNGVQSANLVGTAKDSGGNPQPITVRPNLAEVRGKPIVLVATGRLLGLTDMADTQVQSIYGIVDLLSDGPVYTDLRAALKPLTMTSSGSGVSLTRTVACSGDTAACGSTKGWVVDLPISGERVNVDMALQLGTLVAASNVPRGDDLCQLGGSSMVNFLDFATGGAVVTAPGGIVSATLAGSMTFGVDVYKLPGGDTKYGGSTGGGGGAGSPGSGGLVTGPVPTGPGPASHKEVSWREVTQ
jgi:type IV pilus assembly protein PilY1